MSNHTITTAEAARTAVDEAVAVLNAAMGLDPTDYRNSVSFGYLGNCDGLPGTLAFRDDRSWMVFLPHPGRVGTTKDRIGHGLATDDTDGFVALAAMVLARAVALG